MLKDCHSTQTIAFIDAAVADAEQLLNGISPDVKVVFLDAAINGIDQITQVLSAQDHLTSVHIFSHGQPGAVQLGSIWLSHETLEQYQTQLQEWQRSLAHADLFLYGCSVAEGDRGLQFIQRISGIHPHCCGSIE
jgi:Domain of unknown function (DUF4347)